jgi:hypothetical protein
MQHHAPLRPRSSRPVTIEVEGDPVGVVVAHADGYRFLAVRLQAFGMDGKTFPSIEAARLALGQEIAGARA